MKKETIDKVIYTLGLLSVAAVAFGFCYCVINTASDLYQEYENRPTSADEVRVIDGDTVAIRGQRMRLYGIDAPEKRECYYLEAKSTLRDILHDHKISYEVLDTDQYGRPVVNLYDEDNNNLNYQMITRGGAFVFYGKTYPAFTHAALDAKDGKVGLWRDCGVTWNGQELKTNYK